MWVWMSLGDDQMLLFWLEEVPLEQELLSACVVPSVMALSSSSSIFMNVKRREAELPETYFSP